jgi:hypothetical protein
LRVSFIEAFGKRHEEEDVTMAIVTDHVEATWYDTLLKWLPQHFQDVAAELWSFIQKENPMVRQRDFTRQWHLAAPDQPHIGDRVMRGATRLRGDQGGTGAGEASDAVVMHPSCWDQSASSCLGQLHPCGQRC